MILLVENDKDVDIIPADINVKGIYQIGKFGKCEIEVDACWVLRFCQSRGSWSPFPKREMIDFFATQNNGKQFRFRGLIEPFYDLPFSVAGGNYLIEINDNVYITKEFIDRLLL